jgi:MFS family permease
VNAPASHSEHLTDRARRRLRWVLFSSVAFATTGYIAAVTMASLAARELTGSPRLAGMPSALAIVGTATGTTVLGQLARTGGRRAGLTGATAIAIVGAAVAALGVVVESFLLLLAGMAVLGAGNAASQFARYSAAELAIAERRGAAVSTIVFAGTIGAVAGPRLLGPAGLIAERLTGTVYAGGFMAAAACLVVAELIYVGLLRPDPSAIAIVDHGVGEAATALTPGSAFRVPGVQVALASMVIGQLVMVLIMTATPIHVEDTGYGLDVVGTIISAHTLGMFAFAPLIGRLVDAVGPIRVLTLAMVILATSGVTAAVAPAEATLVLGIALFLLGLGWSFGFVAGSALLAKVLDPAIRPIVQGRVDSVVWLSSATGSLGAGLLLAGPGYSFLSRIGAGLVVVPAALLATKGRRAVPTVATG